MGLATMATTRCEKEKASEEEEEVNEQRECKEAVEASISSLVLELRKHQRGTREGVARLQQRNFREINRADEARAATALTSSGCARGTAETSARRKTRRALSRTITKTGKPLVREQKIRYDANLFLTPRVCHANARDPPIESVMICLLIVRSHGVYLKNRGDRTVESTRSVTHLARGALTSRAIIRRNIRRRPRCIADAQQHSGGFFSRERDRHKKLRAISRNFPNASRTWHRVWFRRKLNTTSN